MKISHKLNRLILRIIHCIGACFGLFVFVYELIIQHSILNTIFNTCYLIVIGSILYLLFARKRPNKRFAYGTFYFMICVVMIYFLSDAYEAMTIVSKVKKDLLAHIVENKELNPSARMIIELNKCCSIDDENHNEENFHNFQKKYPDICGSIEFSNATSCLPYVRNQRTFMMVIDLIAILIRVLTLILLWKYIRHEYNDNDEESTNLSHFDREQSTGNILV